MLHLNAPTNGKIVFIENIKKIQHVRKYNGLFNYCKRLYFNFINFIGNKTTPKFENKTLI